MKTIISTFALCSALVRGEVLTLAHPGEALPENKTVVWSPLFQATWDTLNRELGGKAEKVDPPNELMTRLDSFQWQADKVMPSESWKTWSGPSTSGFLKQVNSEAAALTKEAAGPFTLTQEDSAGRAVFGLLDREVSFRKKFARSRKMPMNFRASGTRQAVQFFGSRDDWSAQLQDTVRVLAYRPGDRSHAIQILCKEADDTVILYRPHKPQDFATACAWLRSWRSQFKSDKKRTGKWDDPMLHSSDEIRIPYLDLESKADLIGKLGGIRHHGKTSWTLTRAEQLTRFNLHEKGARVRVEVSLAAFGEIDPFSEPRRFIYDRPFFVFLWRDGAEWPYFGVWIGDASALKTFP